MHDQTFAFYVVLKIKIPGVFMLLVGVIINGVGIMLEAFATRLCRVRFGRKVGDLDELYKERL